MIVKISPTDYVNTDHIRMISVAELQNGDKGYWLRMGMRVPLFITETAGNYLLELLEANESMMTETEIADIPPANLDTRIAQLLRDTLLCAKPAQIAALLHEDDIEKVNTAIQILIDENVLTSIDGAIYHRSNAPTSSPAPVF